MAATPDDKYRARITATWLQQCTSGTDLCHRCPFSDGDDDCLEKLHTTAADLLEKLAGLRK